jgi:hypothetical protein
MLSAGLVERDIGDGKFDSIGWLNPTPQWAEIGWGRKVRIPREIRRKRALQKGC